MKAKRVIGLVLSCVIAASAILTGCGGKSSSGAASASEAKATETADNSSTALVPASDGKDVYTLKAGHTCTTEHPYHIGLEKLRELLYEKSDGHIILEIYPSGQLGNESDLLEGEQMGTVDLAVTADAPIVNFSSAMAVLSLPYLFESREHCYKVLDSEIADEFWEELAPTGIKGLTFFDLGWDYVHSNTGFLPSPAEMKGQKVRTMENALYQDFINISGGTATPMAMGEVFTALQNGTVNGSLTCTSTLYTSKWWTVAGYLTQMNAIYASGVLTMSQISFDKLPADYQQILLECADEAHIACREATQQMEAAAEDDMVSQGCEIMKFEECDIDAYKKVIYEQMWPKYVGDGKMISQELVDRIQAMK